MAEMAASTEAVATEAAAAAAVAPADGDVSTSPVSTSTSGEDAAAAESAAKSAAVPKLEEDEDCGFCVYMRAGPCGDVFTAWEDCVKIHQEKNEDFARKCIGSTKALTECMAVHKDYYDLPGMTGDAEANEKMAPEASDSEETKASDSDSEEAKAA